MEPVYYIPILTCTISIIFSIQLFINWRKKPQSTYMLWWFIGVVTYGAGTFTESFNSLMGWHELNFRLWYITGALLGGAPLAQGTVYLLLPKKTANFLTAIFLTVLVIASAAVFYSPIDYAKVDPVKMSGKVFELQWVRLFSPFLNLYAVAFLVGGAVWSAIGYFRKKTAIRRFWGNVLIAVGAILPGIGGTFTRFGHVEVLYVTEFLGLVMIMCAYYLMKNDSTSSIHANQQKVDQIPA
jgi:hypothetical protein